MPKSQRNYTKEFKKDAIGLALRSPSINAAASSLGIPEGTLHAWVNKASKSNVVDADSNINIKEELTAIP